LDFLQGADISARLLADWLSQRLAQPFVVENRVGAVGNLATEMVVRAVPDGDTLDECNELSSVRQS
jgi:tripartite-type tricarboxylate transporter receptor subunit TctC